MNSATSDTIVVGLDGSQCSDQALEWAIMEAQRSGRQLVLVHAWHWRDDLMAEATGPAGGSNVRKAGHGLLDRAAIQARKQTVAVTTHLVEGSSAAGVVVEISEGAAMLVVGSHGRSAVAKAFLGSVSKGCVQHAHCPVVIVPVEESTR